MALNLDGPLTCQECAHSWQHMAHVKARFWPWHPPGSRGARANPHLPGTASRVERPPSARSKASRVAFLHPFPTFLNPKPTLNAPPPPRKENGPRLGEARKADAQRTLQNV